MILDLQYAKNLRKSILSNDKTSSNVIYQEERFNIPIGLILDLHVELANLYLGMQTKAAKEVTLNDLSSILNKIVDIAIFLNIDLIVEVEEVQTTAPEVTLNALFNHVSMLSSLKHTAKNKMKSRILPLFVELVYSLGITLEELENAYKANLDGILGIK